MIGRREVMSIAVGTIGYNFENKEDKSQTSTAESWPQFCSDPQNTGYAPENTAPKSPIDKRWSNDEINLVRRAPSVVKDVVFVAGNSEEACAFSDEDGAERWCTMAEGWSTPAVTGEKVILAAGGEVCARSTHDGSEIWCFESDFGFSSSATVSDETVYVGRYDKETESGTIYALSIKDGSLRWSVDGIGIKDSALAVGTDAVYAGDKQYVYALSRTDGTELWRTEVGDARQSAPAVTNDSLYIGTQEGRLYALSTVDGTERWSVDVCKAINTSPAVDGSKVYVSGWLGRVAAISAVDGELQWSQEVDGTLFGSPIVVDSTLFVPSIESGVLAFETADGTERWQFKTGEPIIGSLAVANGTLYAADETGTVYALSHGDPDGFFGLSSTDDLLRIGVGGGIAGLAIGTMYKLFKRAFEANTGTDSGKQH